MPSGKLQICRMFLLFTVVVLLAGCAAISDAEQESLCRRTIPALFGSDPIAKVTGNRTDRAGEVFVHFRIGDAETEHFVFCRFAGSGLSPRKRELVSMGVDGATLGFSATYYVKERWLSTQDAVAAEPPGARIADDRVMLLGPTAAHTLQQALSALPKMGIYALLAASYALLYGLIGRINLAFGAFAALGGISAVLSITILDFLRVPSLPYGLVLGLLSGISLSALFGVVIARIVIVPMATRRGQHLLVASAGLMMALEEFLRLTQGANTRWLPPIFNTPVTVARGGGFDVTLTPMAMAIAMISAGAAILLLVFLRYSRFGMDWRAASDEPVAAALFGIDTTRVLGVTFAIAAALAGFAGTLVAIHYGGIGFAGGTALGLTALVAAILGGIGSVPGALAGGCIIGAVEAIWSATMPIIYKDVVVFALLALMLVFKPSGIFSGREPQSIRV